MDQTDRKHFTTWNIKTWGRNEAEEPAEQLIQGRVTEEQTGRIDPNESFRDYDFINMLVDILNTLCVCDQNWIFSEL